MSEHDRQEMRELLSEVLAEALSKHTCRFPDDTAKKVHQMADHFTLEQFSTLSALAKALNGAGARIGQALIWALFAVALGAFMALLKMGQVSSE